MPITVPLTPSCSRRWTPGGDHSHPCAGSCCAPTWSSSRSGAAVGTAGPPGGRRRDDVGARCCRWRSTAVVWPESTCSGPRRTGTGAARRGAAVGPVVLRCCGRAGWPVMGREARRLTIPCRGGACSSTPGQLHQGLADGRRWTGATNSGAGPRLGRVLLSPVLDGHRRGRREGSPGAAVAHARRRAGRWRWWASASRARRGRRGRRRDGPWSTALRRPAPRTCPAVARAAVGCRPVSNVGRSPVGGAWLQFDGERRRVAGPVEPPTEGPCRRWRRGRPCRPVAVTSSRTGQAPAQPDSDRVGRRRPAARSNTKAGRYVDRARHSVITGPRPSGGRRWPTDQPRIRVRRTQ